MRFQYKFLAATLLLAALVSYLWASNLVSIGGLLMIALCGQLTIACFSKQQAALFTLSLTSEQVEEFEEILRNLKGHDSFMQNAPARMQSIEKLYDGLQGEIKLLRKSGLRMAMGDGARKAGRLTDDAARALAADTILHVERSGMLDSVVRDMPKRERMVADAHAMARAMTTSELPLPSIYGSQIMELIADFGVIRKSMTGYPMAGGIGKPPRMGTRPAFGSIAMSAEIPEKKPTLTFASLEPHKLGGIVIFPTEIDEGSAVELGQFLARYGATEFARAEDTWGFLADGSETYEGVKGICTVCSENDRTVTLQAGKTKPSDATLADFRAMRPLVSTGALSGGRYYLNQTWESRLRTFNTAGDPYAFVYTPDGTARLDGYPITWTEVLQPYSTAAAASSNLAVFGNLRFWWFGQRGVPRVDTSMHAYFLYDQLATRFLEELDFDYASIEAASALATPAA